jgi:hypothetical protein
MMQYNIIEMLGQLSSKRGYRVNKSENIDQLVGALSKLQAEIQNLHKDKQGYGYKYTELSSVLDVARPLCAKYEMAISQLCDNQNLDPDIIGVETVLMHISGQYISSTLYMRVSAGKGMSPAQAAGSVITYARRYALAAILGIAQTDNDASIKEAEHVSDMARIDLVNRMITLIEDKGLQDNVASWCQYFNVADITDLQIHQVQKLIAKIEGR